MQFGISLAIVLDRIVAGSLDKTRVCEFSIVVKFP